MSTPMQRRIAALEAKANSQVEPMTFILRFVHTDGTPVRICRLEDGKLIDIEEDEHGNAEAAS